MKSDYSNWPKVLFRDFPNSTYNRTQGSQTLDEAIQSKKIHPEAESLKLRNFCGMVTINFFSYSYKSDTEGGGNRREDFTHSVMSRIRKLLGKRNKLCWIATHEFGMDSNGHIHLLLSFDDVEDPCLIPNLSEFSAVGQQAVEWVCSKVDSDIEARDVDFHWRAKWTEDIEGSLKSANDGLISYFCKKEDYRSGKNFFYDPKKLIQRLRQRDLVRESATSSSDKIPEEINPPSAKYPNESIRQDIQGSPARRIARHCKRKGWRQSQLASRSHFSRRKGRKNRRRPTGRHHQARQGWAHGCHSSRLHGSRGPRRARGCHPARSDRHEEQERSASGSSPSVLRR